jgi:hypothetical protein
MELDNILIKILGIQSPWNLKKVEVVHLADVVRIEIDYLLYSTLFSRAKFN